VSTPVEAIQVQPQGDVCLWVIGESDASADALPDAAEYALPEPLQYLGEVAGKLADPVPDVPAPAVQLLPPERLARLAQAAPCTPDEVPCGARSCAATAFADAVGQLAAPTVWLPLVQLAVAAWPGMASPTLEPQLVPRAASRLWDGRAGPAPASQGGWQLTPVAGQLEVLERKLEAAG